MLVIRMAAEYAGLSESLCRVDQLIKTLTIFSHSVARNVL